MRVETTAARPTLRATAGAWLHRHETLLWWLHSLWALAFGIGMMWLGSRNSTYLRVAIVHVAFIWITSLLLPLVLRSARLTPVWHRRVQLVVNYFNKNFYQQLLFFMLPIFALSTTIDSPNVLGLVVLGVCALLSTLDLVYDRHLAERRLLTAAFFACTVFAGVAAALPILWQVPPEVALRAAGAAAGVGVVSLVLTERRLDWQRTWFVGGLMLLGLALLVEHGRQFIPPAPLRLTDVAFGTDFDRTRLVMLAPVDHRPATYRGPIYLVTSIFAPTGLHERVRHVWYVDGRHVWTSRWYNVDAHDKGYRLWTGRGTLPVSDGSRIHVDVETEGGQIIGRARLTEA